MGSDLLSGVHESGTFIQDTRIVLLLFDVALNLDGLGHAPGLLDLDLDLHIVELKVLDRAVVRLVFFSGLIRRAVSLLIYRIASKALALET